MENTKIPAFFMTIILLFYVDITHAQQHESHTVDFRSGSDILYVGSKNNANEVVAIKELIAKNEDVILTGNGHIRLVAPIGIKGSDDPTMINLAALRAAVIRNYLKQNFRMLTNWSFTFYLDSTRTYNNTVDVNYMPYAIPDKVSSNIYYTTDKSSMPQIKSILSRYGTLPYLSVAPPFGDEATDRARFDKINAMATNPVDVEPKEGEPNPRKLLIAVHYRWDKHNLDSLYLSNPENLHLLDSILNSENSKYIDTLTIVAYASPEGQPDYNQRLSERRAKTIKEYITDNYKGIDPQRIITKARGENWDGLRKMAINDLQLPSRDQVLNIIDSPLNNEQKQSRLTGLNSGTTYYRYILPNYYRYLRNGASVLITYNPNRPLRPFPLLTSELKTEFHPILTLAPVPTPKVRYPVALKSNLLFDAVGAPNIGIEVPIGKHFSVVGDFAYAFWRSPNNLYALQTLEGGVEGRYWFGVSEKKKLKNPEWDKPLRGWNVGIYGMYCSRYDIQFIDGYQGDGFWSVGLTAGYATPIAKNLTLEFSLAAGYFYTREYRHYHQPEYDSNGDYYLMWQQTGNFGTFTLTKARVSLVWLIRSEKRGGKR